MLRAEDAERPTQAVGRSSRLRQIAAFQMQTMDAALLDLSQKGDISYDVAMSNAHEPEFIKTRTSKPA